MMLVFVSCCVLERSCGENASNEKTTKLVKIMEELLQEEEKIAPQALQELQPPQVLKNF